ASVELARLADEYTNLPQAIDAVRHALALWQEIPAGTDIGDHPPGSLVMVAKHLACEPTSEEDHDLLMGFLSWADSEWLGDIGNTVASQWSTTSRHRFRVARAQGPKAAVDALRTLFTDPTTSTEDREG